MNINIEMEFYYAYCSDCSCLIVLQTNFYSQRVEDHKLFFCINGHQQCFFKKSETELENDLEKLRKKQTKGKK